MVTVPVTTSSADIHLSERSRALINRAYDSIASERDKGYFNLVPTKRLLLQSFDVLGIDQVLAVCYWGRSGSRLFMSFLDSHDHVLMLPMEQSQRIYEFLVVHSDLSLRDRLLAYPFYVDSYTPIFSGDFPIEPAQYYAAVEAVIEGLANQPSDVLSASRTFFQLLHVVYALAIGRRPGVRRPVIIYAQHRLNYHATRLINDFPEARFAHTVRDPVSCFDSTFAFYLKNAIEKRQVERAIVSEAAVRTFIEMTGTDCPNRGMAERTWAIRFEDLHVRTEEVMTAVAEWLAIPYRSSLTESSFNGAPWTVSQNGKSWSGARPAQAVRRSPNMWASDRALIYTLFQKDFAAWNYPYPRVFNCTAFRRLVAVACWLIPTKIEVLNAVPVLKGKFLPALKRADLRAALLVLKALISNHSDLVKRLTAEIRTRIGDSRPVLRPLATTARAKVSTS